MTGRCQTSAGWVALLCVASLIPGAWASAGCARRHAQCESDAAALNLPTLGRHYLESESVSLIQRTVTLQRFPQRSFGFARKALRATAGISEVEVSAKVNASAHEKADIDTLMETWANSKKSAMARSHKSSIIFVGNLTSHTTVQKLTNYFVPYGRVQSCHLVADKGRTSAYVKMNSTSAAQRAIIALDGEAGMLVTFAHLDAAGRLDMQDHIVGKRLDMVAPKSLHKGMVMKRYKAPPRRSLRHWPRVVMRRGRHATPDPLVHQDLDGVINFFSSVVCSEWFIFSGFVTLFVILYYCMLEWPSTKRFHAVALLIMVAVGMIYNGVIYWRLGEDAAGSWFTGYMLELIFSIENVFVFHIVIRAFRTPRRHAQKAIFVVIIFQILFEMVFYMGLASLIRQSTVLPYVLGLWLMYVGIQAVHEDHESDEFNLKDSWVLSFAKHIFGDRLRVAYESTASFVVHRKELHYVTLLVPVTVCLLAVDFLLEVDVTLTKIEELQNHYIAFSSSVAAAFAVPELFFVCRDLFARFKLLKYGVCFVLVFFGGQMMVHTLVTVDPLIGCAITISVMLLFMLLSMVSDGKSCDGSNDEACVEDDGFGPEPPHTPGRAWKERPVPWHLQASKPYAARKQHRIPRARSPPHLPLDGKEKAADAAPHCKDRSTPASGQCLERCSNLPRVQLPHPRGVAQF
mmetsp:Transcript_145985/g.254743  ORF Transcript_145985/g.254743 Transcript_145985/m.254743 type:complete len:686 (-) Transcript_145985:97-2154(-)